MNLLEELRWRGMLYDMTPGAEERLNERMATGYIGFDPTAKSLTIGNYVQFMLLNFFQKSGHKPIVLMGGATGRIGDPSGKDAERQLKSYEELDANLKLQEKQARKFLNFDSGESCAVMMNNYDFYKNMNALDFLRDAGKNLTVSYMLSKESVKKRLETGLSFTEFSYQLLQAYDFLYLYKHHNCTFQMGGSDQWGNIVSGTEFIRRNIPGAKAFAVTTPLLTKSDGKKFGKSEEGNIWLDPNLTSPYKFYQYWINAADSDIGNYMRYFSFKSKEAIEAEEKQYETDPRILKRMLAEELTIRIHSKEDYDSVMNVSELLFNKHATAENLFRMTVSELKMVSHEIPSYEIPKDVFANHVNIIDLIAEHSPIVASKGEARRAIKGNAIAVNKEKISSFEKEISHEHLLEGKYLLVENGKKNKFMIEVH